MILTVTLNPLLERRLTFNQIYIGKENRNGFEELKAGGKGINVSRQLNHLNIDNLAFTFLGGTNGKILKNIIENEGIKLSSIKTKDESRDAVIIIEKNKNSLTTYFSNNTKILIDETEEFKTKLEKMIETCEMVVFSGSSPCEETNSIFPFGIKIANKLDKISVCDTYGKHLNDCIESAPTIIHNNISELENSLGINLNEEKSKLELLNRFYNLGVKQTFLTDGANVTIASNFDFHFKIGNPEINVKDSTGSGDAFTAGIVYGWHNNLTFEESILFASKLGILNASKFEVCNINFEEVNNFRNNAEVIPIGKKMKSSNVSSR